MTNRALLAGALLLAFSDASYAACDQQGAMAKGAQLSQLVQAKMAQDPAAGQAMMMKMQPIMQASQAKMVSGGTVDWDAVCSEYDDLIKQAR